jgi:DNA-binding MarR family transcriptional regulator
MFLLISKIDCVCNLTQCNHRVREYIPVMAELNPAEERAWRAFLDAQASLLRRLEAELVAREGMTLAEFDVLIQLRLASGARLRMTELSERVRLSRSGLTRLVDRLVRAGLVKRGRCATDRRGTWAILTPAGTARVRQARPVHLRGVREHFSGQLSAAQLAAVAEALEPLGRDIRQRTPEPV